MKSSSLVPYGEAEDFQCGLQGGPYVYFCDHKVLTHPDMPTVLKERVGASIKKRNHRFVAAFAENTFWVLVMFAVLGLCFAALLLSIEKQQLLLAIMSTYGVGALLSLIWLEEKIFAEKLEHIREHFYRDLTDANTKAIRYGEERKHRLEVLESSTLGSKPRPDPQFVGVRIPKREL